MNQHYSDKDNESSSFHIVKETAQKEPYVGIVQKILQILMLNSIGLRLHH